MTWLNDDERETAIRAFRAAGYRQGVGKLVDKLEAMGVLHGGGSDGDGVTPCVHVRPGGTTSTEGYEEVHSLDSGLQVLLRHDREILEPHRAANAGTGPTRSFASSSRPSRSAADARWRAGRGQRVT